MTEWTSVEEVRRAERQIVDSVFGAARRLLAVTEPYKAELCGSVILEMWHRGTLAGADPDEIEDWRRMPSAMLPRVRDLAVSVIPAIESDGSARGLATLAALGSVAATPLGDAARAGAERLGRRGCRGPQWMREVGRARAIGAVRGVSGDSEDVVLIGFDYSSGAAHCLFVAVEDGMLADALLVQGNLDDAASAMCARACGRCGRRW